MLDTHLQQGETRDAGQAVSAMMLDVTLFTATCHAILTMMSAEAFQSYGSQEQEASLEDRERQLNEQRHDLEQQQKQLRDEVAASQADSKASAAAMEADKAQLQVTAGSLLANFMSCTEMLQYSGQPALLCCKFAQYLCLLHAKRPNRRQCVIRLWAAEHGEPKTAATLRSFPDLHGKFVRHHYLHAAS